MQTATLTWTATTGWSPRPLPFDADLVLSFGGRAALAAREEFAAAGAAPGPTGRRIGFPARVEIAPHAVSGGIGMHSQAMTPALPGERGA